MAVVAGNGFHTELVAFSSGGMERRQESPQRHHKSRHDSVNREHAEFAFVGQTASSPKNSGSGIRNRLPNKFLTSTIPGSSSHSARRNSQITILDGLEIEAALLKPAAYDGKSKLPRIALIHGGPREWQDSIDNVGPAPGARGLRGLFIQHSRLQRYGQKFMEMNRGDGAVAITVT